MTLLAGDATVAVPAPLSIVPAQPTVSADEFELADLDRLLAVEAPTAMWWAKAAKLVDRLTERMWEHRTQVEGPNGLHSELIAEQPRVAPAVERLEADHLDLADRFVATRSLIGECAGDPDMVSLVKTEIAEIKDRLESHQKRASAVVHDAHNVDIGGE